jgi:hypothetical protein
MKLLSSIMIFVLIGWFHPKFGICQTVYFNKTVDLATDWGSGMSVLADDSSYHIAAITGPGKMISIVELGITGNEEEWIKKYGNQYENWYPGDPGSFCPVPSGGYILGGTVETLDTNYGLLLRFDHLFDTIFSKRYVNNINYSLILTCTKPTFDGGFIFTGENYFGGINTDFILLKTDSLGNELWRTTKSIGLADRGWSIIQTPDSGFVIGGYQYNPATYHSGDPLILKFNKYGTFLWSRNPGGPYEDGKAMVCLNEDSTFTVLTSIGDSIFSNDYSYARICVIKYTQDGVELWGKKYGESIRGTSVSNIKSLPDGGYICCGRQPIPDNFDIYQFGWLFRINSAGDSIWFRRYTYSEILPFYYNSIMDVSLASDRGFIATGQVWDNYPNDLQRIWVLKVDSLGCDSAGCDTTVGIKEQHGSMETWGQGALEIWPNPAREQIHVRFYMDSLSASWRNGRFYKDLGLEIYDIFGRKVKEIDIPSPAVEEGQGGGWTMDVSVLPPGIYLVRLRDGQTVRASAKFVVVR